MKGESSKACEVCEGMKEILDHHTSMLKQLKVANEQIAGMMNSILKSNPMKSFGYLSLNSESNEGTPGNKSKKRQRREGNDQESNVWRQGASSESICSSVVGQLVDLPRLSGTKADLAKAFAAAPASGSAFASESEATAILTRPQQSCPTNQSQVRKEPAPWQTAGQKNVPKGNRETGKKNMFLRTL